MLKIIEVNNHKYKLNELTEIVNNYIPEDIKKQHPTIVCNSRLSKLNSLRCIYTMLAVDMGYRYSHIGKDWNRSHATIIHNVKTGYNLLEVDREFQELYIRISQHVNPKIYPHARINETTNQESDNPRSTNSFGVYSRKYYVTRPSPKQAKRPGRIKKQIVS